MPSVTMLTRLVADPDQLGRAMDAVGADWRPSVAQAELESERETKNWLRAFHLAGGGEIVEPLAENRSSERADGYAIVQGPLPVANYRVEIRAVDNANSTSIVTWSSSFAPRAGSAQRAIDGSQGVHELAFDNLRNLCGMG